MFYDELAIGQIGQFSKTITETDLTLFAGITGDFNPVHVDAVAASKSVFGSRVAHGMLTGSLLCTVYGMYMPGAGAIHLEQRLRFIAPVRIGDTVTAQAEIVELCGRGRVRVRSWCTQQDGSVVIDGDALLLAAHRMA